MLLRRLVVASCLLPGSLLFTQNTTETHSAQLPVRRVVLYKNGVGYFEHAGRVNGNESVSIDFTSSQLDDVLQSLTALDLGGGRITGVNYNSTTPLDQQLKNIPLGLGEKPSTNDLYASLEGARVEVSGTGEAALSGRIVHYEIRSEKLANGAEANHRVLTIVTDAGAIRSLEVGPATSVRVLDGDLRRDLDEYLTLLASTQSRQMRHLTLEAQGTGTRDIRVSYISEVPVWKSTYRIVFPNDASKSATPGEPETAILQGWAVVDNTVGSDWDNVQLSLVAGAPQSFIEPLSQPIYTHRPTVAVPEAENTAPVVHEGAVVADSNGLVSTTMNAEQIENSPLRGQLPHMLKLAPGLAGGSGGGFLRGRLPAAGIRAPPPPPPLIQDETNSASSAKFDDYFEYTVAQPVTLHKNESALVPVLQTNVQAERVTLWNAAQPVPLRALWLTNSGSLTLDRGSFSVFESGEFAGEGLTDPIHAGEKRLLSYAVDQAVHVSTESQHNTGHLQHIAVHNGVLTARSEDIREVTYLVHNAASDARDVIVEHPVEDGWKLNSEVKPVETSASDYRFRVITQPGETVRLHVGETHVDATEYELADINDDQLDVLLQNGDRPNLEKALAPVIAARAKVNDLGEAMDEKDKEIQKVEADSTRLHGNLQGLKDSAEERTLASRYAREMNADEDQLETLRKDRANLEQQQKAAQTALDDAIRSLNLDQDV